MDSLFDIIFFHIILYIMSISYLLLIIVLIHVYLIKISFSFYKIIEESILFIENSKINNY